MKVDGPNYKSNNPPDFSPRVIDCGSIPAYQYKATLKQELDAGNITKAGAIALFEDMLMIRENYSICVPIIHQ